VLCWPAFPLAPPPPPPVARLCSAASPLLWRGLTSHPRASSASAPRLPDADQARRTVPGRRRHLPVPVQGASVHARVSDRAGSPGARGGAPVRVAFRQQNCVGTRISWISRLNGWPARSPADASTTPSRVTPHSSGPMWVATPSSQWTFTTYSWPVSRRTPLPTTSGHHARTGRPIFGVASCGLDLAVKTSDHSWGRQQRAYDPIPQPSWQHPGGWAPGQKGRSADAMLPLTPQAARGVPRRRPAGRPGSTASCGPKSSGSAGTPYSASGPPRHDCPLGGNSCRARRAPRWPGR